MARPSRVVVLAEDERHQRFVRSYLKRLGYSHYFEPLPAGRGCGEQWVRQRYAKEVKAYRHRSARAETALVVVIDADQGDVGWRLRQLQEALVQAGLEPRAAHERIVHLVPKRSIETWILCLNGMTVDEDTDYRHEHGIDERIRAAATTFFEWTRPNAVVPVSCIPSLREAITEARRLE